MKTIFPNTVESWTHLSEAYIRGQLPSTLLFSGKEGVGKMQLAIQVARLIACEKPEGSQICGKCFGCSSFLVNEEKAETPFYWLPPLEGPQKELATEEKRNQQIQKLIHPLLKNPLLTRDYSAKAVHRIECVRDLRGKLRLENSRNQVILIPEADRMSSSVANSLLKILEEAPSKTYFILVSSRIGRILPTILSRSLKVRIPSLTMKEFVGLSQEFSAYDVNQLEPLFYFSEGAPGFCFKLNGELLTQLQNLALEFLELLLGQRSDRLIQWVEKSPMVRGEEPGLELFFRMVSFLLGQMGRLVINQPPQVNHESFPELLNRISSKTKLLEMQERLARVQSESPNLKPQMKLTRLGLEMGWIARGQA